jgi:anti-sigma regulatory factor (Ser/Thr protein kinase)
MVFMRFRPAWAYIDGIREFGRFFCDRTFGTPELADRARIVIQEALENAIKHSSSTVENELELLVQSDGQTIECSISNASDAGQSWRSTSEPSKIQAIDPEQAYVAAFLRASGEAP